MIPTTKPHNIGLFFGGLALLLALSTFLSCLMGPIEIRAWTVFEILLKSKRLGIRSCSPPLGLLS